MAASLSSSPEQACSSSSFVSCKPRFQAHSDQHVFCPQLLQSLGFRICQNRQQHSRSV